MIAGAFYPNYFLLGTVDEQLAAKELSGNDPNTTVVVLNPLPFNQDDDDDDDLIIIISLCLRCVISLHLHSSTINSSSLSSDSVVRSNPLPLTAPGTPLCVGCFTIDRSCV